MFPRAILSRIDLRSARQALHPHSLHSVRRRYPSVDPLYTLEVAIWGDFESGELAPSDIESSDDYIGERYGVVTAAGREALLLAARTEGLILDPVYSSKALSGLVDHVRQGRIGRDEPVVFVHTGGIPAVFSYAEDLIGSPSTA